MNAMMALAAGALVAGVWAAAAGGLATAAGKFPAKGVQEFTTPQGWEDAILVVEPSGEQK